MSDELSICNWFRRNNQIDLIASIFTLQKRPCSNETHLCWFSGDSRYAMLAMCTWTSLSLSLSVGCNIVTPSVWAGKRNTTPVSAIRSIATFHIDWSHQLTIARASTQCLRICCRHVIIRDSLGSNLMSGKFSWHWHRILNHTHFLLKVGIKLLIRDDSLPEKFHFWIWTNNKHKQAYHLSFYSTHCVLSKQTEDNTILEPKKSTKIEYLIF